MKSLSGLTYRFIRDQRKRFFLTLSGVILSVALMTAVFTMLYSYDLSMIDDAKATQGDWHIGFKNIDPQTAASIAVRADIQKPGIYALEDYAYLGDFDARKQEYFGQKGAVLEIDALDEGAFAILPYRIAEGRLPAGEGEIALDPWVMEYMGISGIGDTVVLNTGDWDGESGEFTLSGQSRQYTLVGVLAGRGEDSSTDQPFSRAVTAMEDPARYPAVTILARVPKGLDAQSTARTIAEQCFDMDADTVMSQNYGQNSYLMGLELRGGSGKGNSIIVTGVVICSLIALATIMVIYNAFQISVMERMQHIGLLRCIGMTPAQVRRFVLREAAFLGGLGLPLGLGFGVLAVWVVLLIIGGMEDSLAQFITLHVSVKALAAGGIMGAASLFISALLPARMAGRISPMEAVRAQGILKTEAVRKVSQGRLAGLLFGFSGRLAYKNLSRNRRRFIVTVASTALSIVLFIAFYGFMHMLMAANMEEFQAPIGDFRVACSGSEMLTDEQINAFKDIDGIKSVITTRLLYGYTIDEENHLRYLPIQYIDSAMLDEKNIPVPSGDQVVVQNQHSDDGTPLTDYQAGDTMELGFADSDGKFTACREVTVLASVPEIPSVDRYDAGELAVLVNSELFLDLAGRTDDESATTQLILALDEGAQIDSVRQSIDAIVEEQPWLYVEDYAHEAGRMRSMMTQLSIFVYGFVVVVALICCLNIINTISTNIITRRREIAMLQAVGLDSGQLMRMTAMESIYYAAYACLYGCVIGTIVYYMLLMTMGELNYVGFTPPVMGIILAIAGSSLMALLSAMIPLRRLRRQNMVEAMRAPE